MSFTNRFDTPNPNELFVKFREINKRTGITEANLRTYEVVDTPEGINLWTLLLKMHQAYKGVEKSAKQIVGKPEVDPDLEALQKEFLHEKLMSLRIKNQESLAELIPKDYAKKRSFSALENFGSLVQTTLESASKAIAEEFNVERALAESILTKEYMKIYNEIGEKSVELLEWEEEDATKSIMRTRVSQKYREIEDDEMTSSSLISAMTKKEKLTANSFKNIFTKD